MKYLKIKKYALFTLCMIALSLIIMGELSTLN